jgi:hypothetical protein
MRCRSRPRRHRRCDRGSAGSGARRPGSRPIHLKPHYGVRFEQVEQGSTWYREDVAIVAGLNGRDQHRWVDDRGQGNRFAGPGDAHRSLVGAMGQQPHLSFEDYEERFATAAGVRQASAGANVSPFADRNHEPQFVVGQPFKHVRFAQARTQPGDFVAPTSSGRPATSNGDTAEGDNEASSNVPVSSARPAGASATGGTPRWDAPRARTTTAGTRMPRNGISRPRNTAAFELNRSIASASSVLSGRFYHSLPCSVALCPLAPRSPRSRADFPSQESPGPGVRSPPERLMSPGERTAQW